MIGLYQAITYYMNIGPDLLVGLYKAIPYNDYTAIQGYTMLCGYVRLYHIRGYIRLLYIIELYKDILSYTII